MDREELKEYATGETISKMTYLNQLVSMKRSKFGSPSENEYIKLDRDKSTFKSHRDFNSEKEISFKHF